MAQAPRSLDSQASAFSPVSRTHQASASLRLRATPASTSVSSTRRSGWRSLVITGTESVVNISDTPAQVTPQDTLRRNRCSASRAISIRRPLVSSRNLRILPSAAAARSASDAPGCLGAGQRPEDRDLLAVHLDVRRGREPVAWKPAGKPAAHFRRGAHPARRARRAAVTAGRLATSVRVVTGPGRVLR